MSNFALAIRAAAEPLRSLAFGAITPAYMGIGSVYANPVRIYLLQNLTDATLLFSWNGIDDHFILPPNGFILYDMTTNSTHVNQFFIPEGGRTYVKESGVPTSGAVYVSVIYGAT